MERSTNFTLALALAAMGVPTFPCNAVGGPWGPAKKCIRGVYWGKEASTDPRRLESWWRMEPSALPALMPDKLGLFVIDCDRHEGGQDGVAAFETLAASRDYALPPYIETPSGGRHYYFRQPEGDPLGNHRGILPEGIDVRGAGGYVIVPGASLPDGRAYSAIDLKELHASPDAPDWLLLIIRTKSEVERPTNAMRTLKPAIRSGSKDAAIAAYAERAFAAEMAILAAATKGHRNETLNKCAFSLGTLVGAGALAEGDVRHHLITGGLVTGLGMKETVDTTESGLQDGIKQPRDLSDIGRRDLDHGMGPIPESFLQLKDGTLYSTETGEIVDRDPSEDPKTLDAVFFQDFSIQTGEQLIRRWLPKRGLIVDGGKSQAGKTYGIVDMCVALGIGHGHWCNEPIRERVATVYVGGEGQATLQRRFIAAAGNRSVGELASLPIAVTTWNAVNVCSDANLHKYVSTIAQLEVMFRERYDVRLGLIVWDTARATAEMKEENNNSEVSSVMKRYRFVADHFGCAGLVVHHVGKADDNTLAGAGAWVSNADHCRLWLHDKVAPGDPITGRYIALAKSRIGEIGAKYDFKLETMHFEPDQYGDPITEAYCVWSPREAKGARGKKDKPMSQAEVNRLKAIDTRNTLEECYADVLADWKPSEAEPQPFPRAVPLQLVRKRFHDRFIADAECEEQFDADGHIIPGDVRKIKNKAFDNAVAALEIDIFRKEKFPNEPGGKVFIGPAAHILTH